MDRTWQHRPSPNSFTQLATFGTSKYDWNFDVYLADQQTKSITKVAHVEGYPIHPSRIIDFKGDHIKMLFIRHHSLSRHEMQAHTLQINFDGSWSELSQLRRESDYEELNRVSNSRVNKNAHEFVLDSNNEPFWKYPNGIRWHRGRNRYE